MLVEKLLVTFGKEGLKKGKNGLPEKGFQGYLK